MGPKKFKQMNTKSNSSDKVDRKAGKSGQRTKATIQRLNMYKGGKAIRNKEGKVIGGSLMMSNKAGGEDIGNNARIAPDRRWFGNTRTISQNELDKFKDEMTTKDADPYSVVLRRKKIPMALLQDSEKIAKVNILETESYNSVFGGNKARKRPKLDANTSDMASLLMNASKRGDMYESNSAADCNIEVDTGGELTKKKAEMFSKGQSKRIWAELYKVLDCSDVVLQVVDARNVPGTRSLHIENHIKKNASHKHLVIVLNKCDLVPSWVARKWVKILSKDFPTLAFHASLTNAFGKGALISLLRQFAKLHADKRQISVGVIGYPNVGKSAVINALMSKKCCRSAPVPGMTKVWQYIALMRRIFLIDCPGVVYDVGDDEIETVLKGVVRAEKLANPQDFIGAILERVQSKYIQRHFGIMEWSDVEDFLTKLAVKMGKLIKGGDPNLNNVAVQVINDWQRGKLPFFVPPPRVVYEDEEEGEGDEEEEEEEEEDLLLKIQQAEKEESERDGEVDSGLEGVLVAPPVEDDDDAAVNTTSKKRARDDDEDNEEKPESTAPRMSRAKAKKIKRKTLRGGSTTSDKKQGDDWDGV
mmetsp:Transcript_34912/g.65109  ORF Transcript_34912/g.65109 Transcript_34912/m.65109 type:complete len:587 (-) Transcript_34912:3382-5142(-)